MTVGSELSGTALEVLVDTNDRVTKGQSLAKLDTRKLSQQAAGSRAALASAKAKVSQAQATVVEKTSTLSRAEELKKLSGGKAPSQADMDTAVAGGGSSACGFAKCGGGGGRGEGAARDV